MNRRVFLKFSITGAQLPVLLGGGLLRPTRVLAHWPADAFSSGRLEEALDLLTAGARVEPSDAVTIEAKDIAEDGATVPVVVRSRLPGTRTVFLLAEKNPNPALGRFDLTPFVEPLVDTRIKLSESGRVIAIVQVHGGYFSASKQIEVRAGGCG